jgi:hypothetical protein
VGRVAGQQRVRELAGSERQLNIARGKLLGAGPVLLVPLGALAGRTAGAARCPFRLMPALLLMPQSIS